MNPVNNFYLPVKPSARLVNNINPAPRSKDEAKKTIGLLVPWFIDESIDLIGKF